MLWKRQATRANRKLATIFTSDCDDPPLQSVYARFGSPNCDSEEKVLVGDTAASSIAEEVSNTYRHNR